MTTTALPTRTTDLHAQQGSSPLPHGAHPPNDVHPLTASSALDRADRRLSGGAHAVAAARRASPQRTTLRRSRQGTRTTAPPPAGQVLQRPVLRNAERPHPAWDRMHFLPALPTDPAPAERDALALSTIREARAHTQNQGLPDPVRTAQVVVTAAAEVLAGWRPAEHMGRWASPELYDALARRAGLARRILGETPDPRPRVRTLRVQLTASGACEVCAVLDDGERVRGAGARLESHRGRWLLTGLEIA